MLVRTSPQFSSLKTKKAGNLSVPGLLKVPLGICSKSRA
jgi:hypothetical protein